jgi:hypothetical protein
MAAPEGVPEAPGAPEPAGRPEAPAAPEAPTGPTAPAAPVPPPSGAYTGGPAKRGSLFAQRAGGIVADLMRDMKLTREQAAGLVGNLGYESGGFASLQEGKPISGRGGYGYAQWTGPRRREFEAWSAAHNLDPKSHQANVGFLEHELQGKYSGFLGKLRQTRSIEEASRLTHSEYERPADVLDRSYRSGPQRLAYAKQAYGMSAPEPGGAPGPQGAPQVAAAMPAPPAGGGGHVTSDAAAAGVNQQLHNTMKAAFESILPPGYTARVTSGIRGNNPHSQHFTGSAEDWQIYDPKGTKIANRGEDTSGLYRKAAVEGLARMMVSNPALAQKFAWGRHFETSAGSGVPDLMHYDIGGVRGRFGDPMGERVEAAARARELRTLAKGEPQRMPEARGERVAVGGGGGGVNGQVDVNVTHRNPPKGSSVEATGKGDGVRVNHPRVEEQIIESI